MDSFFSGTSGGSVSAGSDSGFAGSGIAGTDGARSSRHFRRHGGREGDLFGGGRGRLRVTELAQQAQGLNPYSNLNLVGAALKAKGHDVRAANGGAVGGYQGILFTRDPRQPVPVFDASWAKQDRPVNGVYRAGSDHRKDGQAAGW